MEKLKPLISRNEEFYISKGVKKNALASEGKSCRPEKINMRVTTQYEIHLISSQKTVINKTKSEGESCQKMELRTYFVSFQTFSYIYSKSNELPQSLSRLCNSRAES